LNYSSPTSRHRFCTALAIVPLGAVLNAACGSGPTSGKVTAWTWEPPTVQTINTACNMMSYPGKNGGVAMCLSYSTAQEPEPQVCKLTFTSGGRSGTADLNVGEAACKAFLGQHWPPSGTASASS
jgi:hypothetical protein